MALEDRKSVRQIHDFPLCLSSFNPQNTCEGRIVRELKRGKENPSGGGSGGTLIPCLFSGLNPEIRLRGKHMANLLPRFCSSHINCPNSLNKK